MLQKFRNLYTWYRQKGFRATVNYLYERIALMRLEKKLGIESVKIVTKKTLGIQNENYADYVPVGYFCLQRCLRNIKIRPGEDAFLDYGSGKGRPAIIAAMRPFRRVLGVELSAELTEVARANLEAVRGKLACKDVNFIVSNALEFDVPDDITVFFFFNPFMPSIMARVLERIQQSVMRRPRTISLIYVNANRDTQELLRSTPWMLVRHAYDDWCMPGARGKVMILESRPSGERG